jgi:Type I restriction-modification system methyltransferase subunit
MDKTLKNKIDKIWETFWTGGITNPLTVIEQITYLLFIKGLDDLELDNERTEEVLGIKNPRIFSEDKQNCRWNVFKNFDANKMHQLMIGEVFPFIKNLKPNKNSSYSKYMKDAMFLIQTPLILEKVVTGLDSISMKNRDIKGDLYEYLISKIARSGTNGQFRTPRHISKLMVDLMKPTPTDTIVDPACGTSGFLVEAGEYLRDNHKDLFQSESLKHHFNNSMFYGFDIDNTMLRIGAMNMLLHGIDNPNIEYKDSVSEDNGDANKFSLVLANPPFKGSVDSERIAPDLLRICNTKKTELLFLTLFLRILSVGGRCASIVPDGVLFGGSKAHKGIRKELVENQRLEAIISMPSGVFKPYAGVSTAIIIFTKTNAGGTDNVWFYDMTADGYSLDDKREPIKSNDIPDIIRRFNNLDKEKNKLRTSKSFFVPKEEIADNDYDLSINKYKKLKRKEIQYQDPKETYKEVMELEQEFQQKLKELKELL